MSHPCPAEHCDRPAPGTATICGACTAELGRALRQVPGLAAELDTTLSRQHTRTGGGTTDVHDDPTPAVLHIGPLGYDPRASEAAYVLRSALVGWVRVMQENLAPRPGPACPRCAHPSCGVVRYSRGPADTPASMAAWLSAGLRRLARHPAAEEAHAEILGAARQAQHVIDRPADRVFAGRCPGCGNALYARPGAPTVQCRDCDADPVDVDTQLAQMRARVEDQLAHPTGAAALLTRLDIKAPEATIRRWAKQGRIAAHGTDLRGRRLYRIGDIIDTITGEARTPA